MGERRDPSRRALKAAVIILGTLVVLGFVVAIVGRLYLGEERVRTLAEREVGEALAGDVEIGAFTWDRYPTGGVAEDLVLRDEDGQAVLRIDRVRVHVDPSGLLRRTVRITHLEAEGVTVRLIPAEPGGYTLAGALAPPGPPRPPGEPTDPAWRVFARNVDVRDARFEMDAGAWALSIEGLDVFGGSMRWADRRLNIEADARAADLSLHTEAFSVEASAIEAATLALDLGPDDAPGTIRTETLRARVDGSPVVAAGGLTGLAAALPLGFDLDVEADLDLASEDVYAALPEAIRAYVAPRGRARVDARIRGTVDAPDVSAEIAGEGMRIADVDAPRLEATARFAEDRLTIANLFVDLDPGTLRIEGEVDFSELLPLWRGQAALEGVEAGRVFAAHADPDTLPGRVDGTVVASGTGFDAPRGRLAADLVVTGLPETWIDAVPDELVPALPGRGHIAFEAALEGDHARVEPLQLDAEGLSIVASGRVPFTAGGAIDLDVDIVHDAPGAILAALDLPATSDRARLAGRLSGAWPRPDAEARLMITRFAYESLPPADLDAALRLTAGVVHLDAASLTGEAGRIDATGRLGLLDADGTVRDDPPLNLLLRVRGLDLAVLDPAPIDLEGTARGEVRVVGSVGAPSARGRLTAPGLGAGGVVFSRAVATFTADAQSLTLTGLDLRPEAGGYLDGEGMADLDARTFVLDLRGEGLPLSLIEAVADLPVDLAGRASIEGRIAGSFDAPRYQGLVLAEPVIVDEIGLGRLVAEVSGDAERVASTLVLDGEAGRLRAAGAYRFDGRLLEDLRITGDGLRLEAMPGLGALPIALTGLAEVDLSAEGALPVPEVRGIVRVANLAANGEPVHRGRFLVQVGPLPDGALAVGTGLPGALWIRARVEPGPPLVVEATADIEGFDLAWLAPALREAEVDARLVGESTLRYQRDPAEIEARVHLPELEIAFADQVVRSLAPVTLDYDGRTLTLDRLELEGPAGTFVAAGTLGETLDFMARGRLEAAILAAVLPQVVRASGAIAMDLRARGPIDDPDLTGSLGITEPVRFLPRGSLREIAVTDLRARLRPGRIVLDALEGVVIGGAFRARGEATLDGLMPVSGDLAFSGEGLPLRAEDLVAEVDVDLRLIGADERIRIGGTVDLVRGRYRRTFALDAFALVAPESALPVPEPSPLLDRLDLDLRVTSIGAVDARAEAGAFALDMTLDADLQVGGTAAVPRIEGRVSAARGHVEMPQTRLEVVEGGIDFVPIPGDPMRAVIDVLAEGEVIVPPGGPGMIEPTYFVSLSLEGSLDAMEIELLSQPPLDRLEVLALLVTGRVAPAEIAPGDGRHVESAMIFAGTRLAAPLTAAITERLEEILNLDLFVAAVTAEGITITAGTEVSRRLSLEGAFQQGFGDAGAMATARAQFLLSNVLFLEGTAESVAEQGPAQASPAREGSRGRLEIKARVLGGG
jgi:hypothetical protein